MKNGMVMHGFGQFVHFFLVGTHKKPLRTLFVLQVSWGRCIWATHFTKRLPLVLLHHEWNTRPMQHSCSAVLPSCLWSSVCNSLHRSQTLLRPRHSYSYQNLNSGFFPSTVLGYQPLLWMKNSSGRRQKKSHLSAWHTVYLKDFTSESINSRIFIFLPAIYEAIQQFECAHAQLSWANLNCTAMCHKNRD